LGLIVDHDDTITDLEEDSRVYTDEGKEHGAGEVPHLQVSIARAVRDGFADSVEPLMRIVICDGRKASVLRQKKFDLLEQGRTCDASAILSSFGAACAIGNHDGDDWLILCVPEDPTAVVRPITPTVPSIAS
jgi:hypothetical protein